METLKNVHYDAFISYRHSELDDFVAGKLHKKLESFKIPKTIKNKFNNGKKGIARVFRDVEELPLSDDLSESITKALNNSDFFIAVCTPRYIESKWCMKELEVFLQNHDRDHVLLVLADGEPDESFPEILRFEDVKLTDETGSIITERREKEPLAADTRGADKKEIAKAIDTAVIKLCAAILGLNYDDLKQRHHEARVRKMTFTVGGISLAILVFAVFATVTLVMIGRKNVLIEEQYDELEQLYAGNMVSVAEELMGEGRRMDAIYALRSVLPDDESNGYNADVLNCLTTILGVYGTGERHFPVKTYDTRSIVLDYGLSADGSYLWVIDTLGLYVFDVQSGEMIKEISRSGNGFFSAAFCGEKGILVLDEMDAYYYTLYEEEGKLLEGVQRIEECFQSTDADMAFVLCDKELVGIDGEGNIAYRISLEDVFDYGLITRYDLCADSGRLCLNFSDDSAYYIIVADEYTGEICWTYEEEGDKYVYAFPDGNTLYISAAEYYEEDYYEETVIRALDIESGNELWNKKMTDFCAESFVAGGDNIYLIEFNTIYNIDKSNGEPIGHCSANDFIAQGWYENDSFFFITVDGTVYSYISDNDCYDVSDYYYAMYNESELNSNVVWSNGGLYYHSMFANYVVAFRVEENENAVLLPEYTDEERNIVPVSVDDLDVDGITAELVYDSFYSDDGKYIFVCNSNRTVQLIDVESNSLIAAWPSNAQYYSGLYYSEISGGYYLDTYLNSYLLNDDFQVYATMPHIAGEQDGRFIVQGAALDYFSMPYVSYDEVIKIADEMLDGYEPDDDLKAKYGLMTRSSERDF